MIIQLNQVATVHFSTKASIIYFPQPHSPYNKIHARARVKSSIIIVYAWVSLL